MVRLIAFASLALFLPVAGSQTAVAQTASPSPNPLRFPTVKQQAPLMPRPLHQQEAPFFTPPAPTGPSSADPACGTAAAAPARGDALPPELADFVPHGGADDATVCRAARLQVIMAQKAAYEYYANDVAGYHLRAKIFADQAVATKVILVVVIVITLAGLIFSGIQFWVALSTHGASLATHTVALQHVAAASAPAPAPDAPAPATPAPATPDDLATMATQLKIGMDGVQLQSSVLGTTILVISIAFFYLYLKFVYPINDVALNAGPPLNPTTPATAAAK